MFKSKPKTEPVGIRITEAVLNEIKQTIGSRSAEHGGLLGGNRATGTITHFHFDAAASRSSVTYSPDCTTVNRLLSEEWNPAGIDLIGFVHSHPAGFRALSGGDLKYAQAILRHNVAMERIVLPIVMTKPDTGRFELLGFSVVREGEGVRAENVEILVESVCPSSPHTLSVAASADRNDKKTIPSVSVLVSNPVPEKKHSGRIDTTETFRRVRDAYDLQRLSRCRVLYIGAGGAAAFIEDMARAGVCHHVLIDPDIVSETNIATQQTYRKDIGRPKVDCIAERIADINPNAGVVAIARSLDDIKDEEFERLATAPINGQKPLAILICGLTDNFFAQARVNRLALQFGLPSLCAQVYHEGRGAEITFTYPGVTPACHRCILSSRYRAYLEQNFQNNVTSDGTPIFSTTRLNALKGFVAMAILHHGMGAEQPASGRWGTLLENIGNRNLIQIRMDPDIPLSVFDRVFKGGDSERILFDDVVWLPQQPEGPQSGDPACPDCGGSGNLLESAHSFADTRDGLKGGR